MRLFKTLKERILKSIIMWSTMGKQTAQAKEVYLVEVSEIKPRLGFFYEVGQLLEVEDIPNVSFTDYHVYALHCILECLENTDHRPQTSKTKSAYSQTKWSVPLTITLMNSVFE